MAQVRFLLSAARQVLVTAACATMAALPLIATRAVGQSASETIITFDARKGGTQPTSINSMGEIAGIVGPAGHQAYGFLRRPDGALSFFQAPGGLDTYATGINDSGTVVGYSQSRGPVAFLRTAGGSFTYFDPSNTQFLDTNFIDNLGNVAGDFLTTYDFFECYIRTSDGRVTLFTPPGGFECLVNGIVDGTVSGTYGARDGFYSAFLRHPDGTYTVFQVGYQTNSAFVNENTVAGSFNLSDGSSQGYIRSANGTITYFDVAGATSINISGLNSAGTVTGRYTSSADSATHAFQRFADGTIETFDAPGAGTGQLQGTFPTQINNAGMITGTVVDSNNIGHGFLLTP